MKIATYNVNGVNGRLPVLLRWLTEEQPDIVCLQELKAPQEKFPEKAIRELGYDVIWHGQKSWNGVAMLSRVGDIHETRRGLPDDPDPSQSRYIEAAVNGILVAGLYLPNGNPRPGPKFDYKLAWFDALIAHAAELLATGARRRPRRRLQRDADRHATSTNPNAGWTMRCSRRRFAPPIFACSTKAGPMLSERSIPTRRSTPSSTISGTPTPATRACASTICC